VAAIFLQLVWQVDYADGFKGAFFDAYATSAAERFRYDCFVSFNSDSFYSAANHRAEANADLVAFFNPALIFIKYGKSCHGLNAHK
jgi:hypothetical protein